MARIWGRNGPSRRLSRRQRMAIFHRYCGKKGRLLDPADFTVYG